jgi:transposase
LTGERTCLLGRIAAVPELTLEEIRQELAERGIIVGYGMVWRFFVREGTAGKDRWPERGQESGEEIPQVREQFATTDKQDYDGETAIGAVGES